MKAKEIFITAGVMIVASVLAAFAYDFIKSKMNNQQSSASATSTTA